MRASKAKHATLRHMSGISPTLSLPINASQDAINFYLFVTVPRKRHMCNCASSTFNCITIHCAQAFLNAFSTSKLWPSQRDPASKKKQCVGRTAPEGAQTSLVRRKRRRVLLFVDCFGVVAAIFASSEEIRSPQYLLYQRRKFHAIMS